MKIKLSKTKWEEVGEKSGWMNKKALMGDNIPPDEAKSEREAKERAHGEFLQDGILEERIKKYYFKPCFCAIGRNFGTLDQLVNVLKAAKAIETGLEDPNVSIANLKRAIREIK